MKLITSLITSVGLFVFAWCSQALAQDEGGAPQVVPAELYACNYLKGRDRSDLDKVIARWNTWSDAHDPASYRAWVLTPNFVSSDIDFDVAWLGVWPTHADMGRSLQTWRDSGGEMNTAFFRVFSCDQHSSMAVLPLQAPSDPLEKSLVRFSDCTLAEGAEPEQVLAAHRKFHKYMSSKGSDTLAWMFYPGMGAGDIDFDYKLVLANSDYNSLAKAMDIIANGGGWMERDKVFGDKVSCDSFRLYEADLVRNYTATAR
jgi:hypothetical protein